MKDRRIKYISKDLVAQKSGSAFREGAVKAMNTNGYVIIAHEGWVVRKHADGNIEKLHKLNDGPEHLEVLLD